jgi:hypothetical protein
MNPIPTTNAMKPAPGKGVSSFPTPVIKDTVIVEVVNAWKGDYVPLEYGAKWDDYPHASQQGSYPDHKLISQAPNSEDGQWVKRIWANDRVDQDTYNYAIKYSAGSDAHPIYIRTYLEPRETYAPVPDLTPDPLFPGALLVEEEVTRTEGEFDSRYVQVTRVYETLPGPVVPTKRVNERGDLETINTQTVAPGTQPDPDGLLVTQTQVAQEEVSKGVKTTATVESHSQLLIKEKKEGLLGETVTTDDIVDPSTQPDPLSETVVASVVQQTSATKAVKRTTTATGPQSLVGAKRGSGLLGEQTITESIVPSGTQPTPLSLNVVSSEVTPIDSAKSKRTTVSSETTGLFSKSLVDSPLGLVVGNVQQTIVAPNTQPQGNTRIIKDSIDPIDVAKSQRERISVDDWPINKGSDYDEQLGIGIVYEETIVSQQEVGAYSSWPQFSNISYKPIDQWRSFKKTIKKDEVAQALLSQWYKIPTEVDVTLPDKLLDVIVYWGSSYGAGGNVSIDQGASTGSYSVSNSSSSKSSASINGDIYFNIQEGFKGAVSGFEHIFFLEINSEGKIDNGSLEGIIEILNNLEEYGQQTKPLPPPGYNESTFITPQKYKPWPYLQTRTENLVVISGGKAKTENSSQSESVSINGFGRGTGTGFSFDVDVNARSINIPKSLHGRIAITEEIIGGIAPSDLDPTYGVRPAVLESTKVNINGVEQNASEFPAGEYLYSANVELYKWGFVKVSAVTVKIDQKYT